MPDYSNPVAGWNPNPTLYLNYQKYSGVLPEEEMFFAFTSSMEPGSVYVHQKPQWLDVIVDEYVYAGGMVQFVNYRFSINQNQGNNLAVGLYQENVVIKSKQAVFPFGNFTSVPLQVTLQVTEATPLSITPQNYSFNYTIGSAAPAQEYLQITTSQNWSIASNQSWLSFSQTNGSGSQTISLNVNPSGLAPGNYTANFIVDDGNSTKTGTVVLVVIGDGSEEDYISVTPEQLLFSEAQGEAPQSNQTITVDTSESLTIETSVAWLTISESNLASGASTFTISTANTQPLEVGSYPAEITLSGNSVSFTIDVLLIIVEETSSGLENFGFYFAHARNRLNLTNGTPNAEVILDYVTQATAGQKQYKKKIPYYQNALSAVIGLETESLLKPQELPLLFTHFFKPIIPITMVLKVYNKVIGNQSTTLLEEYFGLKWINGKNPNVALEEFFTTNDIERSLANGNHFYRLSFLPKKQYLPKDAIVSFSLYSANTLQNAVVLINGVNYLVNVNLENTNIYTAFINLADYDLSIGDKVSINCGIITSEVIIKDSQLPTQQLIWLNQWDCPEVFNCTGPIELGLDDGNDETTYQVDGKEYTKTIEVKEPRSFSINTGEIYTDEEVNHLASIIRAKKIWIQLGNQRYEVIKNFRGISTFESRRFIKEYDLKFDAATR
ncbi:BACON domain-containing protein [Mesonia mobilis]|uniref:BACON domain-containing protein n=1 Tax=Mesonia mobilis TaxID=369791 RepID=UPI0024B987CB|nr:hypothetical protein [Mesonia mobilis]